MKRSPLLLFGACWWLCTEVGFARDNSVVLGDVRIQALSKFLLRVEPKAKYGWEDRRTFMVVNRDFDGGLEMTKHVKENNDTVLHTEYYSVLLMAHGGFMVFDKEGRTLYDSPADKNPNKNLLHWPSPNTAQSYALVDSPRFIVPEWRVAPCCPPNVTLPSYLKNTNGYDFGNDVDGDTYVFLLGSGLEDWNAARKEFIRLTGPTPLLPDWAYGTWFTWWNFYTEAQAKSEVQRWDDDEVPLDVWGLDMNWRITQFNQDQQYTHPNTSAFPDYAEWFKWLDNKGLHTYFNDHPWGQGTATTPAEIAFRWNGLTQWLAKGLSFWWFDHNWKYSIGPPQVGNPSVSGSTACNVWKGLSTSVWGSHVYFSLTRHYNLYSRPDDKFHGGRPISLSMSNRHNEISGYNLVANPLHSGSQAMSVNSYYTMEHPAHHRFPVWWNGDFTTMNNNLEMMVDAGVHDFKPFVHPDCGGDGWFRSYGELLRQTQMCAFGPILRFHGGPHQPWIYGKWWEAVVRKFIIMRYKMMPMIIAAGQRITRTGFPLVARCDLYWPEFSSESSSNHQYMFLDDILVAPIFDSKNNWTNRDVWIPPGDWLDVWTGEVKSGGTQGMKSSTGQPFERMPMWLRMDGGLLIMTEKPGLRVAEGDWSSLTVEMYASREAHTTTRTVYERSTDPDPDTTNITFSSTGTGTVRLEISEASDGSSRAWVLRLNLRLGEHVVSAHVDGQPVDVKLIQPGLKDDGTPFYGTHPFAGADSSPPVQAGPVAQLHLESSSMARLVEYEIGRSLKVCAWDLEDCRASACCKVSGSKCYEKNEWWSACVQTCSTNMSDDSQDGKPWRCNIRGGKLNINSLQTVPGSEAGTTLFCFTVIGTHKDGMVVAAQRHRKVGIFSCTASKVFSPSNASNVTAVWDELQTDGQYLSYDWTVMVDTDTVFLADRLIHHITLMQPPAATSLYIRSGNVAQSGLLVASRQAISQYFGVAEVCSAKLEGLTAVPYMANCLDAFDVGHMTDDLLLTEVQAEDSDEQAVDRLCATQAQWAAFGPFMDSHKLVSCFGSAIHGVATKTTKVLIGKDEEFVTTDSEEPNDATALRGGSSGSGRWSSSFGMFLAAAIAIGIVAGAVLARTWRMSYERHIFQRAPCERDFQVGLAEPALESFE